MKNISKFSLAAALLLACIAASPPPSSPVRNASFPLFELDGAPLIVDGNGRAVTMASDPGTKLYSNRFCDAHVPILAPDRHQVTLGEWLKASGRASAKCINKGTHVVVEMTGLIPNGVYTIWYVSFDKAGNFKGVGSLGLNDGSQNHFVATASGDGELSAIMPAGPLSLEGAATGCELDHPFALLGVYHLDGTTHGPEPGPDCSFCEQFGFAF